MTDSKTTTERLRELLKGCGCSDKCYSCSINLHGSIADEIEAEIAERYMLLPVDADGVPIRVGDYLQLGDTRGEVVALTYCPSNGKLPWEWQCDTGDWYNTAFAHHVKPRTIEDVLTDFASKQHGITKEENDALIAECAAEIRELMEVDR